MKRIFSQKHSFKPQNRLSRLIIRCLVKPQSYVTDTDSGREGSRFPSIISDKFRMFLNTTDKKYRRLMNTMVHNQISIHLN